MPFVICFDTLCCGFSPVLTSTEEHPEGTPLEFETEELAQSEIDADPEFYSDCFVCPKEEIGHKTIFYGSST